MARRRSVAEIIRKLREAEFKSSYGGNIFIEGDRSALLKGYL